MLRFNIYLKTHRQEYDAHADSTNLHVIVNLYDTKSVPLMFHSDHTISESKSIYCFVSTERAEDFLTQISTVIKVISKPTPAAKGNYC
jgi:hypothetical protein